MIRASKRVSTGSKRTGVTNMAFSTHFLWPLNEAKEILKQRQLIEDGQPIDAYVYDVNDTFAWVSMIAHGYRFDFLKSYVRVVAADFRDNDDRLRHDDGSICRARELGGKCWETSELGS